MLTLAWLCLVAVVAVGSFIAGVAFGRGFWLYVRQMRGVW